MRLTEVTPADLIVCSTLKADIERLLSHVGFVPKQTFTQTLMSQLTSHRWTCAQMGARAESKFVRVHLMVRGLEFQNIINKFRALHSKLDSALGTIYRSLMSKIIVYTAANFFRSIREDFFF